MSIKMILVGGFLGAGKTTSILRLARSLAQRQHRVAIVTNDQAGGLVDSALARAEKLTVAEIAGGCFCCRSDVLVKTIRNLKRKERPDIIIAEPVGSCTDLVATVVRPLESVYKMGLNFAPFSVVVDPFNMLHTLGLESGRGFAPEIEYILKKQMEEAEIVVINKGDIFPDEKHKRVKAAIEKKFPKAKIFSISARTGDGCKKWFEALLKETPKYQPFMDVDYEKYAYGEELLGWFNGVATISTRDGKTLEPEKVLKRFVEVSRDELDRAGALIAHFKAIMGPINNSNLSAKKKPSASTTDKPSRPTSVGRSSNGAYGYCAVQIGGPAAPMTVVHRKKIAISKGHLIINLRAQAEPAILTSAISTAMDSLSGSVVFKLEESSCFKPGKPTPVHRISGER